MSLAISGVRRRGGRRTTFVNRRYKNPGKGLNVFSSDQLIADLESSGMMNAWPVEIGGVSKRPGWQEVGTGLENAPRGLASYYPIGGDEMLITIDGDRLKWLNNSTWDGITGVDFNDSAHVDYVAANGKLYVHTKAQAAAQLDGLTLTTPTTTVRSAFGIYFGDRQVVSGVTEHPNRLYLSTTLDPGDFTNTNPTGTGAYSEYSSTTHPGASTFAGTDAQYIDVFKNDGDKITGLAKYSNQLIIFKERAIYSLQFDANGLPIIKFVTSSIGCVSHWSVDESDNNLMFLSRLGYYVLGTEPNYFDQLRTNELSIRIKPILKTITPDALPSAVGIWHDNVYYGSVAVGNSSENNRVFTYHRQYTAWYQADYQASAFTEFINSNNELGLYYADASGPHVFIQTPDVFRDTYDDVAHGIKMYWDSKAYDDNQFDIVKQYANTVVLFRRIRGSIKVSFSIDGQPRSKVYKIPGSAYSGGMGRSLLGRTLLGGSDESGISQGTTSNLPILFKTGLDGFTQKIRFENGEIDEYFIMQAFAIRFRPKGQNYVKSNLRTY